MHSNKVADCLLYVTFFTYLVTVAGNSVNRTLSLSYLCLVALYTTVINNGSVQHWKDGSSLGQKPL